MYIVVKLIASIIYLLIGGTFPSSMVWVLGLITFCSWFGIVIGDVSAWESYFYHLSYVFLGIILIAGGIGIKKTKITGLSKPTCVKGLLYLLRSGSSLFKEIHGMHHNLNCFVGHFYWVLLQLHKAIFFAILAFSFWIIGRYSEKIWNSLKEKVLDDET